MNILFIFPALSSVSDITSRFEWRSGSVGKQSGNSATGSLDSGKFPSDGEGGVSEILFNQLHIVELNKH